MQPTMQQTLVLLLSFLMCTSQARVRNISFKNYNDNYEDVMYKAELFPEKIVPCGQYAAFLSNVHGIPVKSEDDCVEVNLHITIPATVGALIETDAAGQRLRARLHLQETDCSCNETAVIPLQLIADKHEGDALPLYRYRLKSSFFHYDHYVQATATCKGNYPFVHGLAATIAAARMSNQQKIDLARATPEINTAYESLVFGWRRFFLSSETWNSMLTDDTRCRLLQASDG